MGKFRKGQTEHTKQEIREDFKPGTYETIPHALFNTGQHVSCAARNVYCALKRFNPCRPSFKTLRQMLNLSFQTIQNAIEELEAKCMIRRNPDYGYKFRTSNLYHFTFVSEWQIANPVLSPFEKETVRKTSERAARARARKLEKRKKALEAFIRLVDNLRHNFDSRSNTTSIVEVTTTSIVEMELSETQLSEAIIEERAPLWITLSGIGLDPKAVH